MAGKHKGEAKENVLRISKERGVKFVGLWCTDILGIGNGRAGRVLRRLFLGCATEDCH